MYIQSIQEYNKIKSKVCLSTGADFLLYKKEIRRFELAEDEELSEEKYQILLEEVFFPRAKQRAMHLLERMDRSEAGLRLKLKESGYPEEAVDVAIEYVRSYHYIDDERLARSYIRFYQESRSKMRITQDLMKKGIAKDVIQRCIEEECANAEVDLIRELLEKKHFDNDNCTREERAKMYRFLMGRGFRSGDISKALNSEISY